LKIAGIVAEFNPFHNGHRNLIERVRAEKGGCEATHVAAVMSGNFVQRGEPALLPKPDRVKAALAAGVDLVVELPTAWSLSSAEGFARGGVALLEALGCVDAIAFGSECGAIAPLQKVVDVLESDRFSTLLRYRMGGGIAFPEARQMAVAEIAGEKTADLLAHPNNILAIEYLKALRALGSSIIPFTVERTGAGHDDLVPLGDTASAGYLRRMIGSGKLLGAAPYIPRGAFRYLSEAADAGRCPAETARLERGVLAHLRRMSAEDLAAVPGMGEGLENRVASAVAAAGSWEELEQAIKTKRYPMTRIRRMLWAAFLGIPADMAQKAPPYLRVLGYSPRGREILDAARKTATLPLIGRASQTDGFTGDAKAVWELENRAADLYALTLPKPYPTGSEQTTGMIRGE
jgi:predicted nucleotidyltransferase